MERKVSSDSLNSNLSDTSSDKLYRNDKKNFYLYNSSNILVTADFINGILKSNNINQTVNDLSIWQKAFVHKSYSKNIKKKKNERYLDYNSDDSEIPEDILPLQEESNETLEWLGDGILQSIVALYLYKRFVGQDEGFLTKLRSKLVKTESLAQFSLYLGLDTYIIMSHHVEINCNGRKNSRILEDTFEAFIGAMMLDLGNQSSSFGYELCNKFIVNIIENAIDITELILHDDNYKDQLMRYCQKNYNGYFPKYKQQVIEEQQQNDNGIVIRKFKMVVLDHNEKIIGTGVARSKKEAEQRAAKDALNRYGIVNGF